MVYTIHVRSAKDLIDVFEYANKDRLSVRVVFDAGLTEIDFANEQTRKLKLRTELDFEMHGPITLRGVQLNFKHLRNRVLVRNVRVCCGATNLGEHEPMDCVYVRKCENVHFEQCTFTEGSDEIVSLEHCNNVRFHKCIIGDPLHTPTVDNEGKKFVHKEGRHGQSHGYGLRAAAVRNLIFSSTIFANCSRRCPQANNEGTRKYTTYRLIMRNCIVYNYGEHALTYNNKSDEEQWGAQYVFEVYHNIFVPGPRTCKDDTNQRCALEFDIEKPKKKMHVNVYGIETNQIIDGRQILDVRIGNESDRQRVRPADSAGFLHPFSHTAFARVVEAIGCEGTTDDALRLNICAATSREHVYDNLDEDNFSKLWPRSGWKSW